MTTGGHPPKVQKADSHSHPTNDRNFIPNTPQSLDSVSPHLNRHRSDTEVARSKASSKQRCSRGRVEAATSNFRIYNYQPDPRRGTARPKLDSVTASINVQTLPHSTPGYTGKRDATDVNVNHVWTTEELDKKGFQFIPWNGL